MEKLKAAMPNVEEEITVIKTTGDRLRGKIVPGMFVNEINRAVLENNVDIGIHSLKDLPTKLSKRLEMVCVPERLSPHDALISRWDLGLMDLPKGSTIGTDSPRRIAEIKSLRPDLKFKKIRGNIDTRIRKVDDGLYDGLIVALAALERLGIQDRATQVFRLDEVVPAPGQGALAVVSRRSSRYDFFGKINDKRAWGEVTCERAFLEEFGGGCRERAGAVAISRGNHIDLIAVAHDGGRHLLKLRGRDPIETGRKAGRILCRAKSI